MSHTPITAASIARGEHPVIGMTHTSADRGLAILATPGAFHPCALATVDRDGDAITNVRGVTSLSLGALDRYSRALRAAVVEVAKSFAESSGNEVSE